MALDGKLVGINFASRSLWPVRWTKGQRYAHAIRPDLDWLNRIIDQDLSENVGMRHEVISDSF